ncbi:Phosphoserine phosphatase 1 [Pseudobythopirellula maris]|uniref:Phosphoserine phosphatase 1 n=1 Tax=Pseudobythopirellula maris TaxID=2527991 RepID=A0A5C5ZP94_9BACT|nr:histidine phosphatase family protein [Pseudobythopirellula maris]TWT89030.1 Phosphoserine phosphatase 1 [Pseudobythopirellula maris]
MLTILLVRPGATDYDMQGRIQGTLDIPLSEDGLRQVQACLEGVRALSPVAVYHGPCESAEQTAQLLSAEMGLRPKAMPSLRNLDHGLWQGMLVSDVKTKQPKVYRQWQEQPETVCPPQGETVLDAKARVAEGLRKLMKKHKEGTVAVVVAEPMASVFRHVLKHDGLSGFWKLSEKCGMWESIEAPETLLAPAS